MLNNSGPRAKRSKLERSINIEVASQVVLLLILCLIGVIGELVCHWEGLELSVGVNLTVYWVLCLFIVNGTWTNKFLNTNSVFFPYTSDNLNIYLEGFIRFWTFLIIFQVSSF